ncbi:uncharacterized protein LOC130689896 isoform X2 [Daphnia carinata]|uniref:uncharacterized protein LOC130689896 isoform X2 n=1 Tax=Daphnia carinata TaxID=120202 RepID=UPI00257B22E5|nr:uncharacterized protein LOC130689896 isoform X2 [Daphnia carinata]
MTQCWLVLFVSPTLPGVVICQLIYTSEMAQSERITRPGATKKSLRWPSLPDELLLSKSPKWLRSFSFHHGHPHNPSANFVLPKLPCSDHNFHPQEEPNDEVYNRVVLPPLSLGSSSSNAAASDKAAGSSWLLPTFPAFHRKEVYHRQAAAREHQRRQLSAKAGRLPPICTSSTSPPLVAQSSSAPPPRSPRGVEGTSVTLVSSRSSRAGTRIEGEEEEEVKMASTADVVGHRNEPHVHLWSQGRDEGEEDYDERREREELMALLRPVQVSISGHHAPSPLVRPRPEQKPTVDESKRTKTTGSRDQQTSTPVNTTTDFQWTIEWTPSVDVFRHHSSTSSSDAEELIGEDEMAAPWPVEQHWRSSQSANRVRHSPPTSIERANKISEPSVNYSAPASTSPPVPALRAKTAHPSMSIEHQLISGRRHYDSQDSGEIIEEIEHIFDEMIDIESLDDESVTPERLKEDDDEDFPEKDPPVFGVHLEQLKKMLHHNAPGINNNDIIEDIADEDSSQEATSSSPTFRQDPAVAEHLLAVPQEDCLPNVVQHYHPDDRPISRSPRVVHSPVLGEPARRPCVFEDEEYPPENDEYSEETCQSPGRLAAHPRVNKSRSLASFASRHSPSPDDNGRRQRSLPTRRLDGSSDKTEKAGGHVVQPIKKIAVMPSSILSRQMKAGQSPGPTAKANRPESPQDPRTILQMSLKNIHSSEWEVKVEGIRRVEELITSHNDIVTPEVHIIVLALLEEVKNLRSQVARVAIHCVGKMFQHCGKQMEQDLDRTVPLLLNKIGDTNRFIREDAHSALMSVTEFVSPPKAIVVIVTEGLAHKNAIVRAEAAKLLAAIVVKLGPAKTLSGAKDVTERVLPAAAHFIQDGNLEARAQAKKIFSVLIEDPVFDKAMQKYLSPTVLRNIQRTLDTLRKTTTTNHR